MKEILRFLGSSENDLKTLESSGGNLWEDPTLPFRESRNGRFLINFERNSIKRLCFQPFVLSEEEEFIRDYSGLLRNFRGIQDEIQLNTAFQSLLKFQAIIFHGMPIKQRINLTTENTKWVSTAFQLRTITSKNLIGEPVQEGVHSDGVEHTMTTLLYSKNMTSDSAVSTIHSGMEKLGVPWNKINPNYVVGQFQHKHFLDTLLIVDSELRHSVSPVYAIDNEIEAIRDMIILFTRRPKSEMHSTFKYDSLNEHMEIPLEIKLNQL